jgi:hypothetical protein
MKSLACLKVGIAWSPLPATRNFSKYFKFCGNISEDPYVLGPDPLVTSTDPDADPCPDPSFSHKSVERTEIIQKFSCEKFNFNHQT